MRGFNSDCRETPLRVGSRVTLGLRWNGAKAVVRAVYDTRGRPYGGIYYDVLRDGEVLTNTVADCEIAEER
jgi:hypothetical protein